MSEQNNQGTQSDKLYAGKFKTVEELEQGYNNSAKVYQENDDLKKKFEEVTKIPDDYNTPADVALHDADLAIVKQEAKNSGLTQTQYEKLVRERNARSSSKHQSFEQAKKELGADNINILQDFLKKTYPEKVAEKMLNDAITNKEIRESILTQRQQYLNSTVPGGHRVSPAGGGYAVTEKDIYKARDEVQSSRGKAKVEATKRYINLQREFAHQKQG